MSVIVVIETYDGKMYFKYLARRLGSSTHQVNIKLKSISTSTQRSHMLEMFIDLSVIVPNVRYFLHKRNQ